jgi:hypothetical protein
MSRLFKKHFEYLLKRQFDIKDNKTGTIAAINEYRQQNDINNGAILNRFAKKELKHLVRIECPTEAAMPDEAHKPHEIIKASKRLRYYLNVREDLVCSKCSKREKCKFRDQIPEEKKSSASDLLIFANGLYSFQNNFNNEGSEHSEGKVPNLISDAIEGKIGSQKASDDNSNSHETSNPTNQSNLEELKQRYSYKVYLGALKVTDTLFVVVDDMMNRQGIASKAFMNLYTGESNKAYEAVLQRGANADNNKTGKEQAEESEEEEDEETVEGEEELSEDEKPTKTSGYKPKERGGYNKFQGQDNDAENKPRYQKFDDNRRAPGGYRKPYSQGGEDVVERPRRNFEGSQDRRSYSRGPRQDFSSERGTSEYGNKEKRDYIGGNRNFDRRRNDFSEENNKFGNKPYYNKDRKFDDRDNFRPKRDGENFRPRREGENFKPRGEGENFRPRRESENFRPRRDGENFKPRRDGENFRPRREGDNFQHKREGEVQSEKGSIQREEGQELPRMSDIKKREKFTQKVNTKAPKAEESGSE